MSAEEKERKMLIDIRAGETLCGECRWSREGHGERNKNRWCNLFMEPIDIVRQDPSDVSSQEKVRIPKCIRAELSAIRIADLEEIDSVWRKKKEVLENDLAKAWGRIRQLEEIARHAECVASNAYPHRLKEAASLHYEISVPTLLGLRDALERRRAGKEVE